MAMQTYNNMILIMKFLIYIMRKIYSVVTVVRIIRIPACYNLVTRLF